MTKTPFAAAVALVLIAGAAASAAVLATVRANSSAYPNPVRRVYEKPVFQADKGDVVEIVRWGTPLTQVRTKTGRLGWVESVKLDTINIPAVLSISKPAPKASKLSAADDSALAKRWLEAQKGNGTASAPKPAAVVPPPPADTAKPAVAPAPVTAPAVVPATVQDSTKK